MECSYCNKTLKCKKSFRYHLDTHDIEKSVFSTPSPSAEEAEKGALLCESFGEVFPVNFPTSNITRKMHSLAVVFPKYIREQNIVYKMLKLEQAGEALHKELNNLERSLLNIRNKSFRYYHLLKAYYNKLNLPMDVFKIKKRS